MYEYISGTLAEIAPAYAVVEAGGVGYFINISLNTFSQIERAERVKLFTHHIVREDIEMLYGFASKEERDLFRLLISVSGVGAKTAIQILSGASVADLTVSIASCDASRFSKIKGIGKKTAERIVLELKDKVSTLPFLSDTTVQVSAFTSTAEQEAESALVALGFTKGEAHRAVSAVGHRDKAEDIIKEALIKLSR